VLLSELRTFILERQMAGSPYDPGCKPQADFGDTTTTINIRFRELKRNIAALQKRIDDLEERMDRIPGCPGTSGRGD